MQLKKTNESNDLKVKDLEDSGTGTKVRIHQKSMTMRILKKRRPPTKKERHGLSRLAVILTPMKGNVTTNSPAVISRISWTRC